LVRLLLLEDQSRSDDAGATGEDDTEARLDRLLRFRGNLESSFPAHELPPRLGERDGHGHLILESGNYAVAGALGPLPEALVEQMVERVREGDVAMARFLDLFNHRLNVLRYRLKAAPRLALNRVAPARTDVAFMLKALMGMAVADGAGRDSTSLTGQVALDERSLLAIAGLLSNARRSPPVVTRVMGQFLSTPVALRSLVGAWRSRSEPDLTRLGAQSHALGRSTRLGRRNWMPAARVEIEVAPLPYSRYCRLLPKPPPPFPSSPPIERFVHLLHHPPGDQSRKLQSLIHLVLDRRQDAWVRLRLAPETAPASRLTAVPLNAGYYGLRLGQTAWLSADPDPSASEPPREARFLVPRFAEALS
jgi:type VI secretion system ImpH/TssG family protein